MSRRILPLTLLAGLGATLVVAGLPVSAQLSPQAQQQESRPQQQESKPQGVAQAAKAVKTAQVAEPADASKKEAAKKVSASKERTALKFVSQNHPELAELLGALKATSDEQYQAAIEDVSSERDRLSKLAERDAERHALSLEIWKLNSRVRLAVARFAMAESPGDVEKLVELMKNRNNVRGQLFALDRARLAQRLEKLDTQIEALEAATDEGFAKDIERLRKSVVVRTRVKPKTDRPVQSDKVNDK